ncbi:MAG: YkgJ family cysteine cluster protein, partial [Lachnospiraceae bacterium]|nr:YkgJ family cysteine cluster protein [Lachnospiraceae bacterium]
KVKKWIDTPDLKQNDEFIMLWHDFVAEMQERLMNAGDEALFKKVNMYLLQSFFMEPYQEDDFYKQFKERLEKCKAVVNMLVK